MNGLLPGVPPTVFPCLSLKPGLPPSPNSQVNVPAVCAIEPINLAPLPPYPPLAPLLPDSDVGQPGQDELQLDPEFALPAPPPPPEISIVMLLLISPGAGAGIAHEPLDV